MENSETWVSIEGYEELYEVSNCGRVRSLPRTLKQRYGDKLCDRKWPSTVLKQVTQDGYPVVSLYREGVQNTVKVHRLVSEAFLGKRPDGKVTRHLDDNPWNNDVSNLCYGEVRDNVLDKFSNGYKTHLRKLTHVQVKEILLSKDSGSTLAKAYNVDTSTIYDIRKGKFYKEVYREVMCERV